MAALVGLVLAALLTASFGARSSSQPAALRTSAPPPAPVATKTTVRRAPERKHPVRKQRRHRRHSRHAPAKSAHSTPTLAQAQTPVVTQTEPQAVSQPTQTVASPAPAPKPVKQLSRPKRSPPGGTSFDDSG